MENAIVRKCTNCGNDFTLVLQGEERSLENGHFYSALCDACWEKLYGKPRNNKVAVDSANDSKDKYRNQKLQNTSTLMQKYRVCDLAKDLEMDSKEILRILRTEMGASVKNNLQRLNRDEIAFVFEYLTQGRGKTFFGHPAIVAWDDYDFEGYYVIALNDAARLDRETLVKKCSESQYYYEDYTSAEEAAVLLEGDQEAVGKFRLIKLSDYGKAVSEEQPDY